MFAEKMAAVVGPGYVGAFMFGSVYGLTQVPDQKQRRTARLMVNTYLNNVGKTASRFGNNTAAAIFLYVLTGKLINHLFQEEFDDFGVTDRYKNTIYGGVAGAIYKSTRGTRPMVLGCILGATAGTTYSWLYRNKFFMS
jgi:import inner membrane translocase subunit TIM23